MNIKTFVFIGIFLAIYGLLNYYIALRGWQALSSGRLYIRQIWLWLIIIMALLFPLSRFMGHFLPPHMIKPLIVLASYWLGVFYYFLIVFIGLDFIRLIDHWAGFMPVQLKTPHPGVFLGIIIFISFLLVYGTWNALHPVVRTYEIDVDKKSSSINTLQVVMVSDIHLGWIIGTDRLSNMINSVNSLKPDLVLLAGDIIDEGVDLTAEKEIPALFGKLKPQLGTYAVLGNHEYISGHANAVAAYLKQGGVTVLRDQWAETSGGLYIIGRDDLASEGFAGQKRKELAEIMQGMDKNKYPLFLLDHQPANLKEACREGIDVQFSGHTHRGQFAPNNLITDRIFEQDWGYLKKDHLQVIVSCGFGTWGPPIRIGNRPEIVSIKIHFKPAVKADQ